MAGKKKRIRVPRKCKGGRGNGKSKRKKKAALAEKEKNLADCRGKRWGAASKRGRGRRRK